MKKLLAIFLLLALVSCDPVKEDDSVKRLNDLKAPVTVIAVKPYVSILVIDSLKHIESFTQRDIVGVTLNTPQTKIGDVVVK